MLRSLLLLLAVAGAATQTAGSTQTDQQRLLAQRDAITNWDEYVAANNVTGWVSNNTVPVCLWTYVTCNAGGGISELKLQCPDCAVKAVGTLARELAEIQPLLTLNVQQQKLSGTIPTEYGGDGSFTNLFNLLLQNNELTGSIPASFAAPGAFPKTTLMTFQVNNLTGPLPEPGAWPALQILRMHQNQFTGTLPGSWARSMPNLQILSLHQNKLQGPLPAEWAPVEVFTELQELYLQNNTLSGKLPSGRDAVKFAKLRILDLSFNNFEGQLPAEWGSPDAGPTIETLYLRSIKLNGTLPAEWGAPGHGLTKLRQLWLDGNDLSGTIPADWADLTSLEEVYVRPGNARLCGPLPPNLTFKLCDASGNSACSVSAALDGPTCPPWNPDPPLPDDGDGTNTGAIVGGVVGGVVGGALLALLVVFLVRRRRRQKQRMSPFIAEASSELPPAQNDMSGYAKVLESLEGGVDPDKQVPSWTTRMKHRVSLLFGRPASAGTSPRPGSPLHAPPLLPDGDGGAPAAAAASLGPLPEDASVAAAGTAQQFADVPPGTLGRAASGGVDGAGLFFTNSSTLLPTMDMAAVMAAMPGGTPGASARAAKNSRNSTASDGQQSVEDLGLQQLNDWEIQPEEIEYMKRPDGSDWELGTGGFGKVFKALRNGAQPVAVKVLTSGPDARYMALNEFRREVAILKACRDPNIVAFLGACLREDCAMLVTEYCEGGNLSRNILARKVSWYRRGRKIAIDIAKGLVFLHSRRIVHLDLKSPNILLSRDGTAKVADVGLAKIIAQEYSAVTGAVGTLAWSSPEMLLGARCTERSDIYSYGVILWEIATGQTPIRGQLRDVKVPEECPEELRKLMLDCLEQNPKRRPSAQQIIERLKKIPVSPQEHAAALPPQMLRPNTAAETAAVAAAKAKHAAQQAQQAAAVATAAAEQAAAHNEAQQPRGKHGQQQQQQQQGQPEGAATPSIAEEAEAPASTVAGSPRRGAGSPDSMAQAPVSAFAAAAATAVSPRTASDASELLTTRPSSLLQSPGLSAFSGAAIAPAGSLPTPFSNSNNGDSKAEKSSNAGTQLPAWSSSDDLGSREIGSLDLSRNASTAPGGVPSRSASATLAQRRGGMVLMPTAVPAGARLSPFAASKPPVPPSPPSPGTD